MKKKHVFLVVLTLVVGSLMGIFSRLENWKRDLTVNFARLDPESPDPALRPIVVSMSVDQVADRVEQWVATRSNWTVESRQPMAEGLELHLTRCTKIMRFVDDLQVRLMPVDGGTRIEAESRSRIGKGDLGQNPRNLRELLRGLQE